MYDINNSDLKGTGLLASLSLNLLEFPLFTVYIFWRDKVFKEIMLPTM